MFLDYLYTLPNTTEGYDQILIDTAVQVPSVVPLMLTFIFFFVFLGGSLRQKDKTGEGDFSMWSVVASISVLIVALILSIPEGLMNGEWMFLVILLNIFCAIWFFLDKAFNS